MSSFSFTGTQAFTATHAKHIAAKVATDLKRIQRYYGHPSDLRIQQYETEVIELLKKGYLAEVTYGFQKNDKWIEPTLRYTAKDLAGMASTDDDPGRVRANADTSGASFCSFLTYSSNWDKATSSEKDEFKKSIPFPRGTGDEPGVSGYLSTDKTYSSGGKALERLSVKSY